MNVFHKTVWISWNVMGFVKPKQISGANIRRLTGELLRGSVRHACTRASTRLGAGRVHCMSSFDFPFFLALHGRSLLVLARAFLRRAVFLTRANFQSLFATLVDMFRSGFDFLWSCKGRLIGLQSRKSTYRKRQSRNGNHPCLRSPSSCAGNYSASSTSSLSLNFLIQNPSRKYCTQPKPTCLASSKRAPSDLICEGLFAVNAAEERLEVARLLRKKRATLICRLLH